LRISPPDTQEHAGDRGLEETLEADTVGLRMRAGDLDRPHRRHPLAIPDVGRDALRVGRALVAADDRDRGARPGHHEACRAAAAVDPGPARACEVDRERARDEVFAPGKDEEPVTVGQRVLDRRRVVGDAITDGPEVAKLCHADPPGGTRLARSMPIAQTAAASEGETRRFKRYK
jgi:hypothetical protein